MKNQYCADANFFIDSLINFYPKDIFPSYWEKINTLYKENRLLSIDLIKKELEKHDDEAIQWAKDHKDCFKPFGGSEEIQEFTKFESKYENKEEKKKKANQKTDLSLLAFSKVNNLTLLTSDKRLLKVSRKEDVKCVNIIGMCRAEDFDC